MRYHSCSIITVNINVNLNIQIMVHRATKLYSLSSSSKVSLHPIVESVKLEVYRHKPASCTYNSISRKFHGNARP